jgi:hypothetical protein
MEASLDMNSEKIINLAAPSASSDAARLVDVTGATALGAGVLPSQSGQAGRFLRTDGVSVGWAGPMQSEIKAANYTPVADDGGKMFIGSTAITIDPADTFQPGSVFGVLNSPTATTAIEITPNNAARRLNEIVGGSWYVLPGDVALVFKSEQLDFHVITMRSVMHGCHLYLDASQTFTSAVTDELAFDQEAYDSVIAFHDNVTNPERITIPANMGIRKVQFTAQAQWASVAGATEQSITLIKNASAAYHGQASARVVSNQVGGKIIGFTSAILDTTDGDYWQIQGFQNSGGNLDIVGSAAASTTLFSMKVMEQATV